MDFTVAISKHRTPFLKNNWLKLYALLFLGFWIYTFISTPNFNNWLLENGLTFNFLGVLIYAYRRYQFSDLSYTLMFVYLSLHVYGAMYTYAENPFGYWLQEVTGTERNNYDRIVHFSFGLMLAYPLRELFLKWIQFPKWVSWALPIELTLSMSAAYELIEWAVADIFFKEQGAAYLGTQGDIWDAQKDIFMAVLGAVIATAIVSSVKRIFDIYEED
ncbi:MAG: DUF2238 domain-containing protein [Chitinophagales bacterium]